MDNGPISYASKTLKSAESSAEAEYAAAYQATRDIIFVRHLCSDLGFELKGSCHWLWITRLRNKHFQRAFHLVREEVTYLRLNVFHVRTHEQKADLMTKALDVATFLANRKGLVS